MYLYLAEASFKLPNFVQCCKYRIVLGTLWISFATLYEMEYSDGFEKAPLSETKLGDNLDKSQGINVDGQME